MKNLFVSKQNFNYFLYTPKIKIFGYEQNLFLSNFTGAKINIFNEYEYKQNNLEI